MQRTRERAVTAEGSVEPLRLSRPGFKVSGRLLEILVEEGQMVRAGQPLARLESREQELGVAAAKRALAVAQAELAQLGAAPRAEHVAQAEARLRSAEAQVAELKAGPTPQKRASAEAQVRLARNQLFATQTQADASIGTGMHYTEAMKEANSGVGWEEIKLAEARLAELDAGATEEQLAKAEAAVEGARQELALARAPRTKEDLAVARARLEQTSVSLEQAELALEHVTLDAPLDGTVVEILPRVGEMIRTGEPFLLLADLTELQVETTDLEEAGAAKLRIGQAARITVNAFASKVLDGQLLSLASRAKLTSAGDANFTATIKLSVQDPQLRWGMTTKVEFAP